MKLGGQMKIMALIILLFCVSCSGDEVETAEINSELEQPKPEEPNSPIAESPLQEIPACQQSLRVNPLNPISLSVDCHKADTKELDEVNLGNLKKDEFLARCYQETNQSCWCDQLIRPNPDSIDIFHCTYGENQVHQLIHPDEDTWKYAIEAVKIVQDLEKVNILTKIIYNWWRPAPYNGNVGGSATRHPFGTSIDVRFQTKDMQNAAFDELCKMREKGRLRAIGYYPSTAIHFGIGDNKANTWGKLCP